MGYNNLKPLFNIVTGEEYSGLDDDINGQAQAIHYSLNGVTVEYSISTGANQPTPFSAIIDTSKFNKVTFTRNSSNGQFDITTTGSVDDVPYTSPVLIHADMDGKTLKVVTSGTNFETVIQSVTLHYVATPSGAIDISIVQHQTDFQYTDRLIVFGMDNPFSGSGAHINMWCQDGWNNNQDWNSQIYVVVAKINSDKSISIAQSLSMGWRSTVNASFNQASFYRFRLFISSLQSVSGHNAGDYNFGPIWYPTNEANAPCNFNVTGGVSFNGLTSGTWTRETGNNWSRATCTLAFSTTSIVKNTDYPVTCNLTVELIDKA